MPLTSWQLDALTELANVGMGQAASLLSQMLSTHIELRVPTLEVFKNIEAFYASYGLDHPKLSCVHLRFQGDLEGRASLVFPPASAATLVSLLVEEDEDLDEMRTAALSEVGNIVLNSLMGSMTNALGRHIAYSVPIYQEESSDRLLPPGEGPLLLVRAHFQARGQLVRGDVLLLFRLASFEQLSIYLDELAEDE